LVHEPTGSEGPGLRAAAALCSGELLFLRSPAAEYDASANREIEAVFGDNPDIDVVSSNFALCNSAGQATYVVDPAQDGENPPPCVEDGLSLRASALARLSGDCFVPALMRHYVDAVKAMSVRNIPKALYRISHDRYAMGRLERNKARQLNHVHGLRYEAPSPWLTAVLPLSADMGLNRRAIHAVFRQGLPVGVFEILLLDGQESAELSRLLASIQSIVPFRVLNVSGPLGARLQAAVDEARGALLLFSDPELELFPDAFERHIRAHRERPTQRFIAQGGSEILVEESPRLVDAALEERRNDRSVSDPEAPALRPARSLSLGQISLAPEAIILAGGFASDLGIAALEDLGWRLEEYGYELLSLPEARALRRPGRHLGHHLQNVELAAQAKLAVWSRNAAALETVAATHHTRTSLQATLDDHAPHAAGLEDLTRTLGELRVANMAPLGEDWVAFGAQANARFGALLKHLERLAEYRGTLRGLTEQRLDSVREIARRQPYLLPGRRSEVLLFRPSTGASRDWLHTIGEFLLEFGANADVTLLVLADPLRGGLSTQELRLSITELTRRLRAGRAGGWADVQVAELSGRPFELDRLFAAATAWIGTGEADDPLAVHSQSVGLQQTDPRTHARGGAEEAWPLSTDARYRIFAWPDWNDIEELKATFDQAGRAIANRDDTVLCLRFDPQVDEDPEGAMERMGQAWEATLGEGWQLEALIIEDELDQAVLPRLGGAIDGWFALPSSHRPERKSLLEALGKPMMEDSVAVTMGLFELPPMPFGPLYPPLMPLK